ncbi:MAG: aminotransferase class V-fold PLP-dependent enzyme [bacterium]|nr:aminotransferase class V-fold PLP-dependent enzyme [bacterium]
MKIYLDNASTSFPKAPGLGKAVGNFIENNGINIKRGTADGYEAGTVVSETRGLICRLFHCSVPERAIFTSGATASVNMLLRGLLKDGGHIVISSMEHHAVMRPLKLLEAEGVTYTAVQADKEGNVKASDFEAAITPETKLIFVTHASNVCGTVLPAEEIGEIARKHGIYFALDSAQSAGILDIDAAKTDFFVFSGHKGLMGPQGTGGFILSERLAEQLCPHFAGGTGSYSHSYNMPEQLPDRFEAGTLNIPGIAGLNHSLKYILNESIQKIRRQERERTEQLLEGLKNMPVRIIGRKDTKNRTGVVSFIAPYSDNGILAERLSERGIALRYGLHCSPSAHETLGTLRTGTIRLSVGYFISETDVDYALKAIYELV